MTKVLYKPVGTLVSVLRGVLRMSRVSEPRTSTALRRISAEFIAGHGF